MIYLRYGVIFLFFFVSLCQNTDSLYYSASRTNALILQAFFAKDAFCGTTHTITNILPGEGRRSEVDTCVEAIKVKDCVAWQASDPAPIQCKDISYRIR